MTDQGEIEAISLEDFMSENWDKFSIFDEKAETEYTNMTRALPVDLYQQMRDSILILMLESMNYKMKVKLVIDTNIIVHDAFRVARRIPSTTDRILSSPFFDVYAPSNILQEAERNIRKDLPKDASLRIALRHARYLISKLKPITNISNSAYEKAFSEISKIDPDDVIFLAVAIETQAEAIISWDKTAFDKQNIVKRWEMKDAVHVCVAYESGSFSLVASGISFQLIIDLFNQLALVIISLLQKAFQIIGWLIAGIVGMSIDVLQRIPKWALAIIGLIGIGLLVAAIWSQEFCEWAGEKISGANDIIKRIIENIIYFAKISLHIFKSILICIWNLLLPVTTSVLVLAGVVFRRIYMLINECSRDNLMKNQSQINGE